MELIGRNKEAMARLATLAPGQLRECRVFVVIDGNWMWPQGGVEVEREQGDDADGNVCVKLRFRGQNIEAKGDCVSTGCGLLDDRFVVVGSNTYDIGPQRLAAGQTIEARYQLEVVMSKRGS
jgi:hypothetical protein